MTELSQEILDNWQVRKTKKQKTAFIALLQDRVPGLRVEKGGLSGSRNLILGDVDSAKVVLTAHYDTCAVMPIPNFLTPKNIPFYILYNLLVVAVLLVLAFGAGALTMALTDNETSARFAALILYFLVLFLMMGGRPNRHTANDNTSGVITLLEICAAMTEEQRAATAFVFFDNEESGLLGSGVFWKKHKNTMKDKLLINLDCVSDGDHLMLVIKRRAEWAYGEALREAFLGGGEKLFCFEKAATTLYPSDQQHFPVALAISGFHRAPVVGYYMSRIHTPRDTVFEEENIRLIRDGVLRFVNRI